MKTAIKWVWTPIRSSACRGPSTLGDFELVEGGMVRYSPLLDWVARYALGDTQGRSYWAGDALSVLEIGSSVRRGGRVAHLASRPVP